MREQEIISLLRHKRHDWMNQIQLIQGYASLGKQDRLLEQIEELKADSEHERRLLKSDAVDFPLWLISFNWHHEQFRIKYLINDEVDLSRHDKILTAYGKRMVSIMNEHKMKDELYEGTLHLYQGWTPDSLGLSWEWEGRFHNGDSLKHQLTEEGFVTTIFDGKELSIEMMIG